LSWVLENYPLKRIICLSWDKNEDVEYEKILEFLGFEMEFEKVYFKRDLKDFECTENSFLKYISLKEIDRNILIQVLDQVRRGDHAEQDAIPIEENFPEILKNKDKPWADKWTAAYLDDEIVGIVLPDIFPEQPHKGTFAYIGIMPNFRGKGFGTSLFKMGLNLVKELKATEYLDSTHINNTSMIKIFENNGCQKIGIRRHWSNNYLSKMDPTLVALGWDAFFQNYFEEFKNKGFFPARIFKEERNIYYVYSIYGELKAKVTGKIMYNAETRNEFPAVGDWVVIQSKVCDEIASIVSILPRKTVFSRKIVGDNLIEEQIIAANIDTTFIVVGLDGDFNVRRVERYLTLVRSSGSQPIIVLNKTDISTNLTQQIKSIESIAFGVPIYMLSAVHNLGLEQLHCHFSSGKTSVLVGSSGVGKSTIINSIIGSNLLKTSPVREDDSKGRHTTTRRELIKLPSGGLIIDTPGIRELQLWANADDVDEAFSDIENLIRQCRFKDCKHDTEPDCAIKAALVNDLLDYSRFENYLKLQKEISYLEKKQRQKEKIIEKTKRKKIKIKKD